MPNFVKIFNTGKDYLTKGIFVLDTSKMSGKKRNGIHVLKVIVIAAKGFFEDGCSVSASALTYFTLLSIVPVIALIFAIAKGFGLDGLVENLIQKSFATSPDMASYLIQFSSSMLENTKGGVIAGVGILLLMYSVYRLLDNIENAFNSMWYVKTSRSLLRKVTDYITIMIFAPILLIISSSATIYLSTQLDEYLSQYIGPLLSVVIQLVPLLLLTVLFTLLYKIMPNTKVSFKSAFVAGIVTSIVFEIWQWIFVSFQVGVSKYGAVYGSFAALPLFLGWLQISWIIVLLGCEISYSVQVASRYTSEVQVSKLSIKVQRKMALVMLAKIVKNFADGHDPKEVSEWCNELQVSKKLFNIVAEKLVDIKLLVEIKKEGALSPIYIPAMDINKISVETLYSRLDELGNSDGLPNDLPDELRNLEELSMTKENEYKKLLESILIKNL